jgi:hypothetical protein
MGQFPLWLTRGVCPLNASGNDILEAPKSNQFEMFQVDSQDFCSRLRPSKRLGFIDSFAVQHVFSAQA